MVCSPLGRKETDTTEVTQHIHTHFPRDVVLASKSLYLMVLRSESMLALALSL